MLLNEIFQQPVPGYQDPKADRSVPKLSDVRKTRLTLAQLSNLRQMNDMRKVEEELKIKSIQQQYRSGSNR